MKRTTLAATLAALSAATLLTSLPATAQLQFNRPEDAVRYRQAAFVLQNYHFGRLFAMANGRIPFDAKAALEHATLVDTIDHLPYAAFLEGTDKGNTRAKPEIWTERAKFDGMVTKLHEESAKLVTAARSATSAEQLRPAVGAVAQACTACHDAYRKN